MSANCEEQPTSSTPQTIQLAGIVNDSITDGPGIRLTVFVQGCPHHCPGCHNQQTWDFAGGQPTTTEEIWQQIQQNPLLSGVTFSGGEPMAQAAALLPLAQLIKQAGLELAIYTGYTFEQLLELPEPAVRQLLELCDTLIDGPFILAQRNLELNFRGSANQRILKVTESLAAGQPVLEQSERWH
ncbi:MAG: anaerobic ribonucleoside-triphosphate reductase activating protein [Peptococcaceae bacterium]|jgi:anaerobic ribonucleoside-triphosphate reductase activating protein|nr:anaerobic ribonucleoside-triphosphate reductase activating protein [Peptococcaceae bacterium]